MTYFYILWVGISHLFDFSSYLVLHLPPPFFFIWGASRAQGTAHLFLQYHGFVSRLWFTTCSCAQFASFIGCVLFPKCHQNVDQCGPTSLLVHYWSAPFVHSRLLNNLSFFQTNDCLQLKIKEGYFHKNRHYIHYTLSTLSSVEQFKLSPRHTTNNAQKHWCQCP